MSGGDEPVSLVPSPPLVSRPRRPTRDLPPAPISVEVIVSCDNHDVPSVVESPTQVKNSSEEFQDAETCLTPLRAHYLKKTLLSLQFGRELDGISTMSSVPNVSTLSYLGPPFTPPPRGVPLLDLPFLKYFFRQFFLTFPFLAAAPKNFFPEKLQPFIASVLSRNLSPTNVMEDDYEESEQATRMKVLEKMEKQFSILLGMATKLVEPEEVVRLTQVDLNRLEEIARKRKARQMKHKDVFEVNIVCIRAVMDRGRVRSKVHEEFIIRTRRTNHPDIFVSRRYGDFKTLAEELRKHHPDELIKPPPSKDKTTVLATSSISSSLATSPTASRIPGAFSNQSNDSAESIASYNSQQVIQNIRLSREKNRLTLRAYLHSLMNTSVIASSPVLRHFLLANPTRLSPSEREDAQIREEADKKRDEGRIHFAHEISARVEGLRSAIKNVKGDIMARDGLSRVFSIIRVTEDVRQLPPEYQAVIEWGRITLASTIFQHYVAADSAPENFASLKRLHGLMPYFVLKGILKISNPVAMIRGFLDLFLAQPFGGRSLLQRMFTSSLLEEVKVLEEHIEAIKAKVEDDIICEKVRQFVYAPREIQNVYKADAAAEGINLLTAVLRSGEEPSLSLPQMHRVRRAHKAHGEYLKYRNELEDSDDDDGPQDEDAWLYEDLTILVKLYSQLRDKEQLIELIFEGNTAELLKDIITIFYAPLAQVYKAASIADSLGDLQNFISDLIRTVELAEEVGNDDPQRIVQTFIDLVQRHEQAFYSFVHKVHTKGEGLFDNLMRWIQLFLTVVREGLGHPISLEFLLPHTGEERANVMKEIDEVALYHYKLKLAHEDKLRRRFGKTQGQSDADAEDEAAHELVDSVVHELSFGELMNGEAEELTVEDSDEDESSEDEDEDDSSEYETASESDSVEESDQDSTEDRPPPPPPKLVTRSSTLQPPPQSLHNQQAGPHNIQRSQSDHRPESHRGGQYRTNGASRHGSQPEPRGRDHDREGEGSKTLRSRSRSRSIVALKSMFIKNNSDAPPVPPLPYNVPPSPLSKALPPSPLSARSSQDSRPQPQRRPPPKRPSARKNKKDLGIKPPELKHIPMLLPVFIEMMRPLLRPSTI